MTHSNSRGYRGAYAALMASIAWLVASSIATAARAQAIYPVHRAEILAGARFDFKVEFPKSPSERDATVTINGQAAAAFFGKAATFVENEETWDHSALWLRDVEIQKPGRYVIEARSGETAFTATWEVFATKPRTAKNVILFIGDGLSVAHRTAARMLSKGINGGRYGGELAIDDMANMALVSTAGIESIVPDSANTMSAYTTGHKTCGGAMGVYCAANKSPFAHPRVESLASLAKRQHGMGVGIVTTTEVVDATPAAMVAQTVSRSTRSDIARMLFEAAPDVLLGGGRAYFEPRTAQGSKRADDVDYREKFRAAGYRPVSNASELTEAARDPATSRLVGLFAASNIESALDRQKAGSGGSADAQPDLTGMVQAALDVLSRKSEGFFLMVESGRIDQYSHALDWERAVFETIRLDNAVRVAKEWAAPRGDTLIVVVADHGHPVSIIGTVDDQRPGTRLRDKIAVYDAKFPNYAPANPEGYPPSVEVSRRLAFVFGGVPDHCASGKPVESGYWPTQSAKEKGAGYVANEQYCGPGATRLAGNLPRQVGAGVHAADDVILTADGPGAAQFRGHMENTRVFRAIATALGLGRQ